MPLINDEFFSSLPPSRPLLKGKTGSLVSVVFRTDCTSEVLKVETFSGSCQSHGLSMRTRRSQQCQERKNSGPSFPPRERRQGGERQVSAVGWGAPVRDAFQLVGIFWRISRLFKSLKIKPSILSASHSHHTEMSLMSLCPRLVLTGFKNRKVI